MKYISDKLYEKNPASPDIADGQTLLHWAASNGNLEVVKFILSEIRKNKQTQNPKDPYGVTPAHLAVNSYNSNSYSILLEVLFDVIEKNPSVILDQKNGYYKATVEHCAASNGFIEVVKFYNTNRTNGNNDIPQDDLGRTPFHPTGPMRVIHRPCTFSVGLTHKINKLSRST